MRRFFPLVIPAPPPEPVSCLSSSPNPTARFRVLSPLSTLRRPGAACWLLLAGLLLLCLPAWAQQPERPITPPDSIGATRPDSLRRRLDQERILNSLKAYTKRKTIAGKAAAALFNFTGRREERAGLDAELLDRQYDRHSYKVVRRINISTLDAFGYRLNDPNRKPRNILEKSANTLHIKTSRARVRQVLQFRVGEELEPQDLAESERLLRQTAEIADARVFVNEQTTSQDSVDIEVITRDVFSISGSVQVRDVGAGVIGLRDVNFLGQGHQFRNRYEYGRIKPQTWSYEGSYQVPFRNFITGQVHYLNRYENKEMNVVASRGFYSINTRYAGAVALNVFDRPIILNHRDGSPDSLVPLRFNTQDVWFGRSLRLHSYDLGYENPGRIIVSGRFIRTNYFRRPDKTEFQNAGLVLGTVGYSVRYYYKDTYLFGFGRTEDIPTGTLISLTSGYEFNEATNRRYFGVHAAAASYNPRRGYLYVSGDFGSFVRGRSNDWQQGVAGGEILFFTRLYHTGNYQWRHFFWNRTAIGLNRLPTERVLSIDGDRGLRGFRTDGNLRGTSRFVVNYEATVYTPVSFLGFRMAAVGFADAAWLNTTKLQTLPFKETPFTGFGLGLRFRNEYTAIRTFQILFGFYPRGQFDRNGIRVFENARPFYDFSDFSFGQPSLVRYE
ncbi:hypothetical protein [Hymenobacter sp. DG25B]|uniref:hypothetical protein n=1 Tax=Hymenobacter sp. DG25B TaxID=1385664 RepID=UPI0012E03C75|nr:hypothetical protein [Hymenobacter sp. DG25B]